MRSMVMNKMIISTKVLLGTVISTLIKKIVPVS
jgi:hypothetical protein